ncbi:MAG: C45 family peptidase [Rhodospirillales bacterium]
MALKQFEFSGSHYDIGVALGRLSADSIRNIIPKMERVIALRRLWLGSDRLKQIEAASRAAFPEYIQEIEGIADGADVPFQDVLIWNCRGDLPIGPGPVPEGALGCTTVMTAGGADGEVEIAHNEDGHKWLKGLCHLVTLKPKDAPSVTSFYYPGLISGHNFGFNEFGLVQTVNNIRPGDQKAGLPRHIISRASLACHSMDEALALFRRTDRASGFHYALARRGDRRLLSVEAPASGCAVREVTGQAAHANHLVFKEFDDLAQEITPSSRFRQEKAEQILAAKGEGACSGLEILGNTDNADFPICLKRTDLEETSYTLATARFRISGSTVAWAVYDHPCEDAVLSGVI